MEQEPKKKAGCIKMVCIGIVGVAGLLFIVGVIATLTGVKPPPNKTAEKLPQAQPLKQQSGAETVQEISKITWEEFNEIYGLSKTTTDLKKEAEWGKYKGKKIQWAGTVTEVSKGMFGGITMQVKMNKETLTSDLLIKLKDSEKSKVVELQKGDTVKFTGILENWGSLLPSTINEGEITK